MASKKSGASDTNTDAAKPKPDPRVHSFLDYLRHDRGRSAGTCETYRFYIEAYYLTWAKKAGIDIRKPTANDAQDFRAWLSRRQTKRGEKPRPLAKTTVNTVIASVATFSHWLLRGTGVPNPYADPDLRFDKRALGKRAIRYLRDTQRERVVNWIRTRPPVHARIAFFLMLTAGLRIAEAASVRGNDVWKDDGVVWLSVIGKGNKERNVPVTHPVIGKMVLKRAEQVGSDTLAKIQRRTLLWWAQICRRETKVDFTSHRLRHTFATDAVDAIPIDVLQELLGHDSIDTTRRYAQTKDVRKRNAVKKLVAEKAAKLRMTLD
jgi:site-specific recombinase XerD